ncbi:MAG: hypothetical protein PHE15_05010, partial [Dehalococcoidales bacterium]|nr:hypothetical protein [Dehalococcoidales bacterium]
GNSKPPFKIGDYIKSPGPPFTIYNIGVAKILEWRESGGNPEGVFLVEYHNGALGLNTLYLDVVEVNTYWIGASASDY